MDSFPALTKFLALGQLIEHLCQDLSGITRNTTCAVPSNLGSATRLGINDFPAGGLFSDEVSLGHGSKMSLPDNHHYEESA